MKIAHSFILVLIVSLLSSCQVVGGIFKAGFAVGIIAVLVIVFIIVWLISAFKNKK